MALLITQYSKFRSRPSTQPLGHVADILCYVLKFCWLKLRLNCLFLNYNSVISFLALKTIQIDILYSFFYAHYFKS